MVPGLKKTGSALLFEALSKTESMRANLSTNKSLIVGRLWFSKAQLFL